LKPGIPGEYSDMLPFVKRSGFRRRSACLAAFVLFLLLRGITAAQQMQVNLDPAQTKIEWTLGATMHTVHGTFKLKSGTVKFDPKSGDASGEIIVGATSGESGNHDRDADMHNKVLDSARYPEITFLPRRVIGNLAEQGKSNLQVQGVFKIHGGDHDFTLPMTVENNGGAITASSSFVVPYQDWGMKNPSKMFLHVDSKVDVSISTVGHVTASEP
jgi:polyisoprenoid-binding protein YceI